MQKKPSLNEEGGSEPYGTISGERQGTATEQGGVRSPDYNYACPPCILTSTGESDGRTVSCRSGR